MGDKIRIAFFAEILVRDFDGASRTIHHILDRIPSDQFEVLLFCGVPPNENSKFEYLKIPTIQIPFNKDYSMALPVLADRKLRTTLQDFNPDVIHISTPSILGQFALKYANKLKIPVLTIYHTHFISYIDYYLERFPFLINRAKKMVIDSQIEFYKKCDKVYIPTSSMMRELMELGFRSSNFRLWPRGIDTSRFSPRNRDESYMSKLTGNSQKNILFASRLVWEKNLRTLINIYNKLEQENLPYNLIVAGDGVASDELKREMPNAIFTGQLSHDRLSKLYASSDVFVFTSVSETFGNVVIEAQASGLPVVIADGGGSAGLIEDDVNGYLCPAFDAEVFVNRVQRILENQFVHRKMVQEGLNSIKKYQWNVLMEIYLQDMTRLAIKKVKDVEVFGLPMTIAFS